MSSLSLNHYYTVDSTIELRNGQTHAVRLGLFNENDKDAICQAISKAFSSHQGTLIFTDRTDPANPISKSFLVAEIRQIGSDASATAALGTEEMSRGSQHAFIDTVTKTHSCRPPERLSLDAVVRHNRSFTKSDYKKFAIPVGLIALAAMYYATIKA